MHAVFTLNQKAGRELLVVILKKIKKKCLCFKKHFIALCNIAEIVPLYRNVLIVSRTTEFNMPLRESFRMFVSK